MLCHCKQSVLTSSQPLMAQQHRWPQGLGLIIVGMCSFAIRSVKNFLLRSVFFLLNVRAHAHTHSSGSCLTRLMNHNIHHILTLSHTHNRSLSHTVITHPTRYTLVNKPTHTHTFIHTKGGSTFSELLHAV